MRTSIMHTDTSVSLCIELDTFQTKKLCVKKLPNLYSDGPI